MTVGTLIQKLMRYDKAADVTLVISINGERTLYVTSRIRECTNFQNSPMAFPVFKVPIHLTTEELNMPSDN